MARCMKCGGSHKKAGKGMNIAKVGQYMGDGGLVGMPKYTSNMMVEQGRVMKIGGVTKAANFRRQLENK